MINRKLLILPAALLLAGSLLQAQTFQQGFFLRDYRHIYRINPALRPSGDFIGGFEVTKNQAGNLGASAVLFPMDGEVVTGLHASVPADRFLGSLPELSKMKLEYGLNLFSYGFARGDAFHTFEIGLRVPGHATVPKDVFRVLKLGTTDAVYDMSRFGVKGSFFVELAYGYSHRIGDIVSLGGRAKLLLPLHGISYQVTRFDVERVGDGYQIFTAAELDLPRRLVDFQALPGDALDLMKLRSHKLLPLPTGAGLALDLGVAVTPNEYLTLSASVLDLGGVAWYYGNAAGSSGYLYFDGLGGVTSDQLNEAALKARARELGEKLLNGFRPLARSAKSRVEALPFTAHLGARYILPFYEQVSVGAMAHYVNEPYMPYWETRLGADYTPWEWLDLTGSFGRGSYGWFYGFGFSARMERFRLYFGYQNGTRGHLKMSSLPLDANRRTWTVGLTYDL